MSKYRLDAGSRQSSSDSDGNSGCGCGGLIITILILWALFFGLPIGESKWNIDIFPPKIWDMNIEQPVDK